MPMISPPGTHGESNPIVASVFGTLAHMVMASAVGVLVIPRMVLGGGPSWCSS
ncbi:MAG TPA: hypothetical protein VK550_16345 [Polyangiaceae bacterium]|nr:hypothetical protein [Polyangiaceae bacterium]